MLKQTLKNADKEFEIFFLLKALKNMNYNISFTGSFNNHGFSSTKSPLSKCLIGALVLIFGLFFAATSVKTVLEMANYRAHGMATNGYVSEVAVEHYTNSKGQSRTRYKSTILYYLQDGKSHSTVEKSQLTKGQQVALLYLPEQPDNAIPRSRAEDSISHLFPLFIGLIFSGLGTYILFTTYKRYQEISWLKVYGINIKAVIIGINSKQHKTRQRSYTTYNVIAQGQHPIGGLHRFESEDLSQDPGENLIGQETEILVDPQNPQCYYFEF